MAYSDIIYKYRKWSDPYHRNVLLQNELYFSSPADMNDPFDCKIPIDYSVLDTDAKRQQYVEWIIKDAFYISELKGIDIDPNVELKRQELLHRLVHDREIMEEEYDLNSFMMANDRFGVLSFSQRWDSILMWAHYAENHTGFCVGFNRSKLSTPPLVDMAGGIKYCDYHPLIDPLANNPIEQAYNILYAKAKDWSYEEEYRCIKIWVEKPSLADRLIQVPDDYIEEIVLGMLIKEEDKREILNIANQKNIPVYAVKKRKKAILLERERVQ